MNQVESDKLVARAIARNRSMDPEARLALARKFDPDIKLNEGAWQDFQEYENSIINPNRGRVPESKNEMQTHVDADGNLHAIFTKDGEFVRETVVYRNKPVKYGTKR